MDKYSFLDDGLLDSLMNDFCRIYECIIKGSWRKREKNAESLDDSFRIALGMVFHGSFMTFANVLCQVYA